MSDLERFLSQLDTLPNRVFFGDVVYEPGGTYGPRIQPDYQLLFIHSGSAEVEIDGQRHPLGRGEMALLRPGHREFFRFSETTRTHHRWCNFTWSLSADAARRVEELAFDAPLSQRAQHLTNLGLSLQHDPDAPEPLLRHLAAASFWEFVGAQREHPAAARATLPGALTRVQTYLAQHYADDLSLAKLGAVASLSPEHLTRLFRKHLRTTPTEQLWQVRTQQGLLYLRHTGLPVEQVAYRCGFKTAAHFSRRIKARYGLSPRQIRADYWLPG